MINRTKTLLCQCTGRIKITRVPIVRGEAKIDSRSIYKKTSYKQIITLIGTRGEERYPLTRGYSTIPAPGLDPHYVTGFAQADGSFCVSMIKVKHGLGLVPLPAFTISQDNTSLEVLKMVRSYFKCGKIAERKDRTVSEYVVSLVELESAIIPHFNLYPLHGAKQRAFKILVIIVERMKRGHHKTAQGLADIIQLVDAMNEFSNREGTALELTGCEPSNPQPTLPEITPEVLADQLLVGLIDGDGSFYVSFAAKRKIRFGFNITGGSTERGLLDSIKDKFGCGTIRVLKPTTVRYNIEGMRALETRLIPFVDQYRFYTKKEAHYQKFKQLLGLFRRGHHKTDKGFMEMLEMGYNMNSEGKRRKHTLEEYIRLYMSGGEE